MATQPSTKTVTLSGTFSTGPSGLVPAAPTQSIEDLPIPFGYTPNHGKVKLTILLGIVIPVLGITLAWLLFKTIELRFHWETEEMKRQDEGAQLSGPSVQGGDGGSGQQPVTGAELVALIATGRCPEGFEWRRNGDRYICAGGGHNVPVADL